MIDVSIENAINMHSKSSVCVHHTPATGGEERET